MKLEPIFKSVNNQLALAANEKNSCKIQFVEQFLSKSNQKLNCQEIENNFNENFSNPEITKIVKINVFQDLIETEPESYNEEFLANFREDLKSFEEKNIFAILNVLPNENLSEKISDCNIDDENIAQYVAVIKHSTRRIKDCQNLIGVELNNDFLQNFSNEKIPFVIDELYKKHSHYVYFIKSNCFENLQNLNAEYLEKIVKI